MQKDYTIFQIPSFKRGDAYDFEGENIEKNGGFDGFSGMNARGSARYAEIYRELNDIAEELEKCRLRNS